MSVDRRGFLGLLAHLPLVGAWLGKPWSPVYGDVPLPPMDVGPTKWLTFRRHGLLIDSTLKDVKPIGEPQEMQWASYIHWIPLEREPPRDTLPKLVCDSSDGVVWVSAIDPIYPGYREWVEKCHVTHWADMPAPPSADNHARMFNGMEIVDTWSPDFGKKV